jgi:isoleucyl-tRNA synthetase
LEVFGLTADQRAFLEANAEVATAELNVKEIAFAERPPEDVRFLASLDKREAARRLGPRTPAVAAALQALDSEAVLALVEGSNLAVTTDAGEVPLERGDVRVAVEAGDGFEAQFQGGVLVALDTRLTPALEREGIAREVSRMVNRMRQDLGLEVEDRIRLRFYAEGHAAEAVREWSDWIAGEVLAAEMREVDDEGGLVPLKLPGGHVVKVAIERA